MSFCLNLFFIHSLRHLTLISDRCFLIRRKNPHRNDYAHRTVYIGGLPILKEGGDVMDLQGVLTELLIEFNMEAVNLGAL